MAIARLKKIRLLAHNHIRSALLEELQQSAFVHIMDLKETVSDQALDLVGLEVAGSEISDWLEELEYAINFLTPYEPPRSRWEELLRGKPSVTRAQLAKILKENNFHKICRACRKLDTEMSDLAAQANELNVDLESLSHWCKLPVPIEELAPTKDCQVHLIKIPSQDEQGFRDQLAQAVNGLLELYNISEEHGYNCELMIYFKQDKDKIAPILANYGVEPGELPEISGTPAEAIIQKEQQLQSIARKQEELNQQAQKLAVNREKLALAYDYYVNQRLREEIQERFLATSQAFLIEGWINRRHAQQFKRHLEEKYGELEILISDAEPGEIPPVELVNNRLVSPFEVITTLYGLPRHDELDPTPLLAPFFFIFFGLCLTDAGYGLILALLTYWGLQHLFLAEGARKMMRLLFFSGLAAIVAGAITGSWLGDILDFLPGIFGPIREFKNSLILFDPIKDPQGPMIFMLLSLMLGFLQVWFGIAVKMYAELSSGDIKSALMDQFPWILIFAGLALLGLRQAGLFGTDLAAIYSGLIYTGIVIILLFGGREHKNPLIRLGFGILGLYNVTGYFSDILSYSRLLALGLATGVIATVVNKIAFMTTGIPVIGYIFMFLILIGGHIFNLAISGLGAFVHTSRLQFVEFFPKFFHGGGNLFTPFSWENKYSVIRD